MRRAVLVSVGATAAVLGLGGALTGSGFGPWYESLRKPAWQPPSWLFGPAWSTIGALTAYSAVLAWDGARTRPERTRMVGLFAANGVLNVLWSALFFNRMRPDWALAEVVPLWLSIGALMAGLAPLSRRASGLLTPYFAWVSFASVLNLKIVQLNRPFGRA